MPFPVNRMRRLRSSETMRRMMRENVVSVDNLIYPLFVVPGLDVKLQIPSMPGMFHYSVDALCEEAREVKELGIPAVLLFGLPRTRTRPGRRLIRPTGSFSGA